MKHSFICFDILKTIFHLILLESCSTSIFFSHWFDCYIKNYCVNVIDYIMRKELIDINLIERRTKIKRGGKTNEKKKKLKTKN